MSQIQVLLKKIMDVNAADPDQHPDYIQIIHSSTWFEGAQFATLEPDISRPISPMWQERFRYFGEWANDPFGKTWLDIDSIGKLLTNENRFGGLDLTHKERINVRIENWESFPPASVAKDKCTMFAFDPLSYDEAYLVWLENREEPIIFDYFGGSWTIFANLNNYLEYIAGDKYQDGNILDDRREFYDIFDLPRDIE